MKTAVTVTLGQLISDARKAKKLNFKDCASLILKEDGSAISSQYLRDLEMNRRNTPSDHVLKQLSQVLGIPLHLLYIYSNKFPPGITSTASPQQIDIAFQMFVEKVKEIPA